LKILILISLLTSYYALSQYQPDYSLIIVLFNGCNRSTRTFFQEGVSSELARYRSRQIYDVSYQLHFSIPESHKDPVTGNVKITFKPLKARHGVILDFTPGESAVHQILVNGNTSGDYFIMHGHIYIDANDLVPRQPNTIDISFTASDQALNRSEDFMYSLFVPDRASTAFPCFDQPDIKAPFSLSLTCTLALERIKQWCRDKQYVF
jgi:aminopeptidase N